MKRIFICLALTIGFLNFNCPQSVALMAHLNPGDIDQREWILHIPAKKENPDEKVLNQAFYFYQNGLYNEAEDLFNRLLVEYPKTPEIFHYLGLIKFKQGKLDHAVIYLNEALLLQPEEISSLYNRGVIYYNLGKWEQALKDVEKILTLEPDHLGALNTAALSHKHCGDLDKALSLYGKVLEIDPQNYMAAYNRALLYFQKKQYSNAISDLEDLLKKNPDKRDILTYFRGECFLEKGEKTQAEKDFQLVSESKGPYQEAAGEKLLALKLRKKGKKVVE